MDKALRAHYDRISRDIDALKGHASTSKIEEIYYYHLDRIRDFQHERLIHLLVTFFFSALLILAIVGLLWVGTLQIPNVLLLEGLLMAAGLVLFVTVLFYVRHYYRLENGVQRLYGLTERLRELMEK